MDSDQKTNQQPESLRLVEPTYLCQAWGETDLPVVAIVRGLDAVRAFLVEQWLGDAEHEHDDGTKALPAAMADMQAQWALEGEDWKWSIDFEIGGISVQRVDDVGASHAQAPAGATLPNGWRIEREPRNVLALHQSGTAQPHRFEPGEYVHSFLLALLGGCPGCGGRLEHEDGEPWGGPSIGCVECGEVLPAPTTQAAPTPTHEQIAAYLEATGAYVTNDASREAAIADAVAAHEAQAAPAAGAVAGPMDEMAELSLLNRLIELGYRAAGAHATSNSDDGHKGTAAYVQWQEIRAEMGELIRAAYAAAPTAAQAESFQQRVQPWLLECFGAEIAADRVERNHRFLEEALELVQSLGCTASEAHQLVDYVFGRPVGEPVQETGGAMVTLAALCLASGLDMHQAGETELARISVPELVAKIRAKQAAKPKHSPLPEAVRADSGVQEDAPDPLQGAANWLAEAHGQFGTAVLQGCLMIGYNRAKRLHDAALAAKGEKHGN